MRAILPSAEPRRRGRPPKDQTRPDAPRARLLRTGVAILTEKGFSAVGVEEILDAAEVPKGSFYHYFDSKEAFGLALIDAYANYFARKLDRWFDDTERAPLDRLRDFIADARSGMARHRYRRGCLVGNLGQEMGVLPEPFRKRLAAVFRDWEARTSRCLRSAQEAGEMSSELDCEDLAQFFWMGWEGAVLRAKLERRPDALDVFAERFLAMIRAKGEGR
ncbi:TetR family transcriptional regulator [Bradyrhizobium zhanjiangense]|uniref:TetR family transcriptional regulator n=1 Tax=Bradyrhizobium zhanjiangense TaxID=1325107 RepID=A0A4Q0SJN7_9BRAD|nr:TetR family transcriptional regulator [Bradyrhizobium zhanjiangense]RXG96195.1 TetR family transcriptional regulator [Bradyrhizobium zhanjiangense]RXH39677.1 TetR family transcriptional regulator [Bradyrhizobium zhanjiangense]